MKLKTKRGKSRKIMIKYQIDQSGKIEQTNSDTILALSNHSWDAVVIKARIKRQLQEVFRRNGQIRNFILFTFSAGLSILIKRNTKLNEIFVDREYFGKEAIIKNIVLEILMGEGKLPEIYFEFVGKLSAAHDKAAKIAHGKEKGKKQLSFTEILSVIKKTEVGKRLKNT